MTTYFTGTPPKFDQTYTSKNRYVANPQDNIDFICIHGTAKKGPNDSVMSSINWLMNPTSEASSNFVIDKTGHVYCLVNPYEGYRAWANGIWQPPTDQGYTIPWLQYLFANNINPNRRCISIEHDAWNDDMTHNRYDTMPQAQLQASIALVTMLIKDFQIPFLADQTRILPHGVITTRDRPYCPGVINVSEYRLRIKNALGQPTTPPFNPNPQNLTIGQGFLQELTKRQHTAITNEQYYVAAPGQTGLEKRSFMWAKDNTGQIYIYLYFDGQGVRVTKEV